MKQAVRLAQKGAGFASTNPLVGCVIIRGGKVIGRGYYKKFGGPHAEVNALKSIKGSTKGSTAYVTLEPHSYQGKTPPCTDALIEARVKRVVIGMLDPNPKVAGQGVRKLKKAGIGVEVGVLQKECEEINLAFTKWVTTGEPYVVLKTSVTLDGFLTFKKGKRSHLACPESNDKIHELRQQLDAIAVGIDTALIDDPMLTCRREGKKSRNPVRVVFDTSLKIKEDAKMFSEQGKTIIFTGDKINQKKREKIESKGDVEVVKLPVIIPSQSPPNRGRRKGCLSLVEAIKWLGKNSIASILVEGGAGIANAFIEQNLIDKYMIVFTPNVSEDKKAPRLDLKKFNKHFDHGHWEMVGADAWLIGEK